MSIRWSSTPLMRAPSLLARAWTCAAVLAVAAVSAPITAHADDLSDARALVDRGQYTRALTKLDSHLQTFPQDAEARFTRGLVLVKLSRVDEAISEFSTLTRDYPQLPEPYNNLAVLYAQTGDYEKARDALESALATHPSYATAHENLGDVYTALATAAYNRALVLDQGNDTVRVKLSLLNQLDSQQQLGQGDVQVAAAAPEPAPVYEPEAPVYEPEPAPVYEPEPVEPLFPAEPAAVTSSDVVSRVSEEASAALYAWAKAWTDQDVDSYLAAYDVSFQPDNGRSRASWARNRRERVAAPGYINVSLIEPTVEVVSDDTARATFTQVYESPTYSDRVVKVLEMRKRGPGDWRIVSETTQAN